MDFNELQDKDNKPNFTFDLEEVFFRFRWPIAFLLIGLILVGAGIFFARNSANSPKNSVEIIESSDETRNNAESEIIVEVSGAVEKPGVFKLSQGSRVEDALVLAGGVSVDADRDWMEKVLNRASKLTDGQKIFIPKQSEVLSAKNDEDIKTYQSQSTIQGSGLININTASQEELESLWGIGPVYAQNIIEQRPYSNVEELLTKKVIRSDIYEKNKDKLTVY